MASLNKVQIIGNLGRDPEVRYTADGAAIANLSLATTSSWKDKNTGEKREETEWHRCVFYGKIAEIVGQYAKKGRPLYVEGRLKTRKWTDKDGIEKYTTEIVCDQMQLLGSREDGGGGSNGGGSRSMEDEDQSYGGGNSGGGGGNGGGGGGNNSYARNVGASSNAGGGSNSYSAARGGAAPAPARRPAPVEMDDDIPF